VAVGGSLGRCGPEIDVLEVGRKGGEGVPAGEIDGVVLERVVGPAIVGDVLTTAGLVLAAEKNRRRGACEAGGGRPLAKAECGVGDRQREGDAVGHTASETSQTLTLATRSRNP
jgi:hypothetical protein